MKQVLKKVLKEIKPKKAEEEKISSEIDKLVGKLNKILKDGKAVLGGSRAKDTYLKGTYEADIFVRFNYEKYKDKSQELSKVLAKALRKAGFRYSVVHGSRDYFQIKKKPFVFEIIPILDIKKASEAKNITDISPLHTKWVKKNSKYKDEIRLVKHFCKSLRLYGAESHIQGFSGYVLEILTIHYKGFENLLKNAAKWKVKTVVDVEKHHKNVFMDMNKSKLTSPLIVVDPVDASRNAAAALGRKKFDLFVRKAKEFLKNPSEFYIREINEKSLKEKYKGKNLLIIKVKGQRGKRDVIGSRLKKVFDHISKNLSEFEIIVKDWHWDEKVGYYWFVLGKKEIDAQERREGPPVKSKWHASNFKKKYKKTFVENGRLFAYVMRKHNTIDKYVGHLLKDDYVKERVKEIKHVK